MKKKIPKLRFREFIDAPEWEEKRLGEVCTNISSTISSCDYAENGKYTVYGADGISGYINEYFSDMSYIAVLKDGSNAGKVFLHPPYSSVSNTLFYLKIINDVRVEFLYNILSAKKFNKYIIGSSIPHLYFNDIKNDKFFKPLSTEQVYIANYISLITKKIHVQNLLLKQLEEEKKGYLQKLFPRKNTNIPKLRFKEFLDAPAWQEKKLGDISSFKKGKGISKNDIVENGFRKCIHYGELFTLYKSSINRIFSKTNRNDNVVMSVGNEVLMPTSDVTPYGLCTASAISEAEVIIGGDILIINSEEIYNTFLSYIINSSKNEVLSLVTGVTVFHIYERDMATLIINYPTSLEQKKVAKFLTIYDRKITIQQKILEKLEIQKNGYLQNLLI